MVVSEFKLIVLPWECT